jgi:hypothetical protein
MCIHEQVEKDSKSEYKMDATIVLLVRFVHNNSRRREPTFSTTPKKAFVHTATYTFVPPTNTSILDGEQLQLE